MDLDIDHPQTLRASLLAGAVAGQVGVLTFWAFHTIWIADVPAVLLEGVLWGAAAGAAVGWGFHHLVREAGVPTDWRGGLFLAVLLWLLLLPYQVVGVVWGPFTHLTRPAELLVLVPFGFLSVPLGIALGWALTHHVRPALVLGLATALSHFMVGGSLVYFGGQGPLMLLLILMLPSHILSGLVLVRVRGALLRRAPAGTVPSSPSSDHVNQQEVKP